MGQGECIPPYLIMVNFYQRKGGRIHFNLDVFSLSVPPTPRNKELAVYWQVFWRAKQHLGEGQNLEGGPWPLSSWVVITNNFQTQNFTFLNLLERTSAPLPLLLGATSERLGCFCHIAPFELVEKFSLKHQLRGPSRK